MENKIYSINGPVVTIKGKTDLEMMEMVYVGKARLVGEVIRMNDKETTIQVYEETGGLKAGEPVESTGGPLSVTLGPGILRNIYDGIQRPLPAIEQHMGSFIEKNVQMFTDFQNKMADQAGGVDAWAKMVQMSNPLMNANYAEQMQKMQEQMQKQTEQMMSMFGLKR